MTNPTLERAARALHEQRSTWPWVKLSDTEKQHRIQQARAVLMAVSDITDGRLGRVASEAANDAASCFGEYATEYMMLAAHKAVIQAILNGEGE